MTLRGITIRWCGKGLLCDEKQECEGRKRRCLGLRRPEWQEGEHQRLKMWVTRFFGAGLAPAAQAQAVFRVPYSGCCPCVWAVGCHLYLWRQPVFICRTVDSSCLLINSRFGRLAACIFLQRIVPGFKSEKEYFELLASHWCRYGVLWEYISRRVPVSFFGQNNVQQTKHVL